MTKPNIYNLHRTQLTQKCFSRMYPEYYNYIINKYKDIDWKEALYLDYNNITPTICPVCGKKTRFISITKGYSEYCSQECAWKSKERINKIQSTNTLRYGYAHALQNESIKNRQVETCIKKYGVDNYSKTDECKSKVKNTCIKKYGGVGSGSEELKRRAIESRRKNRLNDQTIKNQIGYDNEGNWIIKCDKIDCPMSNDCPGYYTISSGNYCDRVRIGYDEFCTRLNPITHSKIKDTYLERFVCNILDKYNIKYVCNCRDIILPKEVDIYIPDKNIAIECNGIFWHSMKDDNYHINKFNECRKKEIQLITLWQDWIINKPMIVESMLLSRLGLINDKIYARKCNVRIIDSKTARLFLDENHIQGKCSSNVNLGLFHNDTLISIMCFKKRNNNNWELVRFCSLINTEVIGAAGKLLNYFKKEFSPIEIISYSSNDISLGKVYEKLGFQSDHKISKSYWYIDKTTLQRFHRFSFSKYMLKKKGMYIEGKTEREIMSDSNYWQIYDSGMTKWILSGK